MKRFCSILMICMILIQSIGGTLQNVFAVDTNLTLGKPCGYHLQYWNAEKNKWLYIDNDMVLYNAPNGKQYPAYCLNYGVQGVGDNGQTNQVINVDETLKDDKIWRLVTSSYPYKSLDELGVTCEEDAYIATRQAIYAVLLGRDYASYYRGGDTRGNQIYNLLVKLCNEAIYGTAKFNDPIGEAKRLTDIKLSGNYYESEYCYVGNASIKEYKVYLQKFPSGTIVTDKSNDQKLTYTPDEHFKVRIPKDKLTSNINGTIDIKTSMKSAPVFYGRTYDSGMQNYAVATDPYVDTYATGRIKINSDVTITGKKTSLADNIWTGHLAGVGVAGAVYEIRNLDTNTVITNVTTNANGNFSAVLKIGNYSIKEIKAPLYYELDKTIHYFKIDNIFENINIDLKEDVVSGGYFNLVKTSSDDNIWTGNSAGDRLSNATFSILKSGSRELVQSVTTNSSGVLSADIKLPLGSYILKETKAPNGYYLDNKDYPFTVSQNKQIIKLNLSNTPEVGGLFNLEKTSSDGNLWTGNNAGDRLSNATFSIFKSGTIELVQTVTTNSNGTLNNDVRLHVGNYILKETKAPNGYYLDDKEYLFTVSQNKQVIKLNLSNIPVIAGLFNLEKTSSDDNLWLGTEKGNPLANAKYVIRGKNIETGDMLGENLKDFEQYVTTNESGTLDNDVMLYKGKYTIQEVESPNKYYIDKNIYEFEITDNKQVVKIDLTDEPVVAGLFNLEKTSSDDNLWLGTEKGNKLANAKYVIRGKNIETGDMLGENLKDFEQYVTTNESGTLDSDVMLYKGKYTIQEVESPNKYYIDKNIYEFEITDNKQVVRIDVTDEPVVAGLFNLEKTSSDDSKLNGYKKGSKLANARYVIKGENVETGDMLGKNLENFKKYVTTNESGTLDNDVMLYKGKYTIQEVESPSNYMIDKKIYEFEITNNKQVVKIDLTDEPVKLRY